MFARKNSFSFSDVGVRSEEDESLGSESFSNSPSVSSAMPNNFDFNFLLGIPTSSELSSSSSHSGSLSQASRAVTPSDWQHQPNSVDSPFNNEAAFKWAADSLISQGIDPSALLLGNDGTAGLDYGLGAGAFNAPTFPMDSSLSQLQNFQQMQNQQSLSSSAYVIPEIVEPPRHAPRAPSHLPLPQSFIHQQEQMPPSGNDVAMSTLSSLSDSEIARISREAVGVGHAIPLGNPQAPRERQWYGPGSIPHHSPTISSAESSSAQSPPPTHNIEPTLDNSADSLSQSKGTKSKTSHTTIERRYRTNLNARIVGLRHAVPALRILEKDKFPNDKADENGYVDGVKAARKASKGSILGKAAEYIGVLKRRELRLRREMQGLRELIGGLVGGAELLAHWEREWRARNGGEERDIAPESEADDEDGSDDEDAEPVRKKAKVAAPSAPIPAPVIQQQQSVPLGMVAGPNGELKRKRGRPRKHPLPGQVAPASRPAAPTPMVVEQAQHIQAGAHAGGAKYLLGVFMIFSFFNGSTPSSPSTRVAQDAASHLIKRSHVGTVIASTTSQIANHPATQYVAQSKTVAAVSTNWESIVQLIHAFLSLAVFLSIIQSFMQVSPSPEKLAEDAKKAEAVHQQKMDLNTALDVDDRESLAEVLNCHEIGMYDALRVTLAAKWASFVRMFGVQSSGVDSKIRAALVRFAELDLMHNETLPFWRRLYHTQHLRQILSSPTYSELTTLAILSYALPFSSSQAYWSQARAQFSAISSPSNHSTKMLLEHDLEDAVALFESGLNILGARLGGSGNGTDDGRITPLGLIATGKVCEAVRIAAGELFVRECPDQDAQAEALAGEAVLAGTQPDGRKNASKKADLEEYLSLGKGLTKPVRDLVHLFEDISMGCAENSPTSSRRGVSFFLDTDTDKDETDELADAKSVLESISLYRRIASAQAADRYTGSSSPISSNTSTLFMGGSLGESSSSEGSIDEEMTSSLDSSAGPSTPRDVEFESDSNSSSDGVVDKEAGDYDVSLRTPTLAPALVLPSAKRTPRGHAKVSVSTRLALRQMLASKAFSVTSEMHDARDRMIDYLVDTVW